MADAPQMDELAKRYLDLWEEQFTAMAGDQTLAEQIGRLFAVMGRMGPAAMLGCSIPGAADERSASDPAGTAAAGSAPDRGDERLAECTRRLADVENRLAALEQRSGGTRRKAAPRSRAKRQD